MRVWHFQSSFLDSKRLIAAHNEIHCLRTCVEKGTRWGNFPGNYVDMFKHSMHSAQKIHDETVIEMARRRNLKLPFLRSHPTPFKISHLDPIHTSAEFLPTEEQLIKDIQDLRGKWEAERYFYGVGRTDLRFLEEEYHLPVGPTPEEAQKLYVETRSLLQKERAWFNHYRSLHPKSRMQDRMTAFHETSDHSVPTESPSAKPRQTSSKPKRSRDTSRDLELEEV